MAALVEAVAHYAGWLYGLLGLFITAQLATMWRAGRERDLALFELERQAATGKAVRAFVTLLLLVVIGAAVYSVANVVAPNMPADPGRARNAGPIVLTPQLSELPTTTATADSTPWPVGRTVVVTATPPPAPEAAPTASR
ncbi:MAG: hypothetical protein ACE5EL_05590 [Anaerolineae bacterium]